MGVTRILIVEDEPNMVDHPVFFCPFCGSRLQTPEQIDAKTSGSN